MDLKIPEDQFKEIISATILEHVTGEQKERILTEAVRYLLEPRRDDISGRKRDSPLQEAFKHAVDTAATQICHQLIVEGPYREQVEAIVREGVERAISSKESLVDRVANSISKGFSDMVRDRDW